MGHYSSIRDNPEKAEINGKLVIRIKYKFPSLGFFNLGYISFFLSYALEVNDPRSITEKTRCGQAPATQEEEFCIPGQVFQNIKAPNCIVNTIS
jgi:hypothetical protein